MSRAETLIETESQDTNENNPQQEHLALIPIPEGSRPNPVTERINRIRQLVNDRPNGLFEIKDGKVIVVNADFRRFDQGAFGRSFEKTETPPFDKFSQKTEDKPKAK